MDVFVSYRRSNDINAQLVYYALKAMGLSVFLDTIQRKTGNFPEYLKRRITESSFFLLIIGPKCLERKNNEIDWFKQEIDTAIEQGKNIIPILTSGMKWPKNKNEWPDTWLEYENYERLSKLESITIKEIEKLPNLMSVDFNNISLLKLLKKSVSSCKACNISDYIIKSKEMNMGAGSKMFLLTDNLDNYDFSTIAKMAISRNISNGSKYVYYTPKACEEEFNVLASSIYNFIRRTEIANKEIEKWIRKKYLYNQLVVNKMLALSNVKKTDFNGLLYKEEILKSDALGTYFEYDDNLDEVLSIDFLIDWLKGVSESNCEIDDCFVKINRIKAIIENDEFLREQWMKIFEYLLLVKDVSDWIMKKNNNLNISNLCKRFKIPNSIVNWLNFAVVDNVNAIMNNLEHHIIQPSELSFIPCYSFSLFQDSNDRFITAAWYTSSNENNASVLFDNTVVMHECRKEELTIIVKAFYELLNMQNNGE